MVMEPHAPQVPWDEEFYIEPDLGDQRRSTYKALPAPPKTPKRVMLKYRFSGVFPFLLSLTSFVLTLVVVLAGQSVGTFEGHYLLTVNASSIGKDMLIFERVNNGSAGARVRSSTAPIPISKRTSLESTPTSHPLNGLSDSLSGLSDHLIDAANSGLSDAINGVIQDGFDRLGVHDVYYLYLRKVCLGQFVSPNSSRTDANRLDNCRDWEQVKESISAVSKNTRSALIIGQTRVSVPLLTKIISSSQILLASLNAVRKVVFALLLVSMIGSLLSAISAPPAMYFPQSRLLVYLNMIWPIVATIFASIAAILLSASVVLASIADRFSSTVGVRIELGHTTLLFSWLGVGFSGFTVAYWLTVWFVEVRKSSFVKRRRDEDEIGHWKGVGKEIWRDMRGRRRKSTMRADI